MTDDELCRERRSQLTRGRWIGHGVFAVAVVLLLPAALALIMNAVAGSARADICGSEPDAADREEARALLLEPFSQTPSGESVDFAGEEDYNAKLIECNRRRDTLGPELDAQAGSLLTFGADLEPRTVKGHYGYAGLAPFSNLRYGYDLRREADRWIVTVPIEFHWPTVRMTDMVDIPYKLAYDLGLTVAGEICAPGSTQILLSSPREIAYGYIHDDIDPAQVGEFIADQRDFGFTRVYGSRAEALGTSDYGTIETILETYDVHAYLSEASCRLPRTTEVAGMTVLNHLREYWRESISKMWNRDDFEIVPRFVECETGTAGTDAVCGGVSDEELSAWEKDETIWQIHFNLTPWYRASYKRWLFKWNNMHTGTEENTIAHEVGHQLGLDDEYAENAGAKSHCLNQLPSDADYLMCVSDAGRAGAKGVYPWIITRRFAVGRDYQCQEETDCKGGEFCAKNGLNRNVCEPRRPEGEPCSREDQCQAGLICHFNPLGMCVDPSSVGMNGACERDIQCISGACNTSGRCQCNDDNDCDGGEYCAEGFLGLGQNDCQDLHDEGDSCSREDQCETQAMCHFNPLGMCVTPNSVGMDGACERDIQCISGACNTSGRCQCNDDNDCDGGEYCAEGVFGVGQNDCQDIHDEGDSCSREDQCEPQAMCHFNPLGMCVTANSVGMNGACDRDVQCTTGACNTSGRCQCNDDGDCDDGYCAEGALGVGQNSCESWNSEGDSCSRQEQCRPEAQCHFNPLGMCVTANSVGMDGACERDVQCTTGACNTSGRCQCNDDGDCPGSQECREGPFGIGANHCE